jgi:four helix bundle protein
VAKRGTKGTEVTKDQQSAGPSLASLKSLSSLADTSSDKFIPPHGGYQDLLSYQKALIVYDATLYFCNRFFTKFDRTREQMTQAARSGKQNILEGSEASGTSKETEIKLTNTARASLKELLEDYRDFMRNRGIEEWKPVTFAKAQSHARRELRYC